MSRWLVHIVVLIWLTCPASVDADTTSSSCSGILSKFSSYVRDAEQVLKELKVLNDFSRMKLSPGATRDEIQASYRNLVRLYHPDKVAHLKNTQLDSVYSQIFQLIHESYERLLAGKGRNFGIPSGPPSRPVQKFEVDEIRAQKERLQKEFLAAFKISSRDGLKSTLTEQMLQFFTSDVSQSAADQRILHIARAQMIEETLPPLIKTAKTFQELHVIQKLLDGLSALGYFVSDKKLHDWHNDIWSRSIRIEPDATSDFIRSMGLGRLDLSDLDRSEERRVGKEC